ncbi:g2060 [Coccomyxa viridis]|uniref:G2060 protein n=1 Tax=Coccomyxa viridis TaxID=1274662 RepID=A0ABP1FPP4_9CHLO
MADDTTNQQDSAWEREKEQHLAKLEQLKRQFAEERELHTAALKIRLEMCAEKYESQLRTLQQKAKSDAAERHPAAVLSTHQAHKIEQTQYLAKVDDTTQQQNSTLEGEREQHSSEFEEMQRRFAEEQELISAEFKGKREASDAEYDAQLTSLHEEAQKDAARRYAAAGQCKQQAHKLEQGTATAPLGPLEMVRKALISLCPEEPKLAETFKLEDLQRLYDAGYRCKSIMKEEFHMLDILVEDGI